MSNNVHSRQAPLRILTADIDARLDFQQVKQLAWHMAKETLGDFETPALELVSVDSHCDSERSYCRLKWDAAPPLFRVDIVYLKCVDSSPKCKAEFYFTLEPIQEAP